MHHSDPVHTLSITTFGQTRVRLGDQDVAWHAVSAQNLFYFLLSYPEGRTQTDIVAALWPDEEGESAASSNRFRVALHRVRAALGDQESVVKAFGRFRLSRAALAASDVYALHAALHDAEIAQGTAARQVALRRAVELYSGEYLSDHRADWAITARSEHKASYVRATLELSMLHCEAAECDLATWHLAQALRADPLIGENYHQDLMACLASVESKYAAVEHYRRFIAYLRDDLDDTPMQETTALAERLKGGELICPHQIGNHAPCTRHLAARLAGGAAFPVRGPTTAELVPLEPDGAGVHAELERVQLALKLAELLQGALSLGDVAHLTLQALGTALDLEYLFLFLVDDGVLRVSRIWGEAPPDHRTLLERGQMPLEAVPLVRQALVAAQAQYLDQAQCPGQAQDSGQAQDLDYEPGRAPDFSDGAGPRKATGAVPILGPGSASQGEEGTMNSTVEAVMSLSRRSRPGGWTARERLLLAQAGRTLSFTLDRSALSREAPEALR